MSSGSETTPAVHPALASVLDRPTPFPSSFSSSAAAPAPASPTTLPGTPAGFPFTRPDLSLLDAVGQCGDLAEAARRTGSRGGAVERQLERLDKAVGLPLTLRGRHTARLTSAGSRLLAAGRRFFRQVDLAVRTDIFGHGPEAVDAPAVLAIASAEPFLEDVVEDAAAALDILLSVHHDTPQQVMRRLAGYHVDAAHTWSLDAPGRSLERPVRTYPVLDDPLWVTLPQGHRLAGGGAVPLADLRDETWVSEVGPDSEVLVARVFQAAGLPAPAALHVTGASVARGMLRRGDAIGLGSPTRPAVVAPSVVHRSLVERPHRSTSLLVDPTVVPGALAEHLAELLADRYLHRFADRHPDLLTDPWWTRWYRERTAGGVRSAGAGPAAPTAPDTAQGTRKLDVDDLHVLRAVARHGSINRAAAVLSISQSALTRRIHRLELGLGAQLLLRSARGTDLTGSTRSFLHRLGRFEAEFHEAAQSCRGLALPGGTGTHRQDPRAMPQPAPSAT
ncbi:MULTISPECIES: LysR family transcriptional regulator [unclassified Streptomyces]|uniref:LysR family transcriptional regulator n=1 Tax=Streptomyces sp. NPDC001910 TaxID=3154403 RepID=UPI00331DCB93